MQKQKKLCDAYKSYALFVNKSNMPSTAEMVFKQFSIQTVSI